jgi:hypothetical protein
VLRNHPPATARRVLAVGALLVLGAGCSGGSDGGADAADPDETAVPVESAAGTFDPLDGFDPTAGADRLTGEERAVITSAEYRLTERCMADAGFEYPTPAARLIVARAVPFLSPTELRRSAYAFDWDTALQSFSSANDPANFDPTATMSPERADAYTRALNGPVDGPVATLREANGDSSSLPLLGCSAEARVELYGSVLNALRFDRADLAITGQALSEGLQADPRYEEAKRSWQECMIGPELAPFSSPATDYGFYILHSQMLTSLGSANPGITPDQERQMALADADCQESSGLYEIREELLPGVRESLQRELDLGSGEFDSFARVVFERAREIE